MNKEGKMEANKWEGTVMQVELSGVVVPSGQVQSFLKVQAEISFKAGEEEEYKRWVKYAGMAGIVLEQPQQLKRIIPQIKGNEHKAGFGEVVEWVDKNCPMTFKLLERWQAFLKERLEK